MIDILLIFFTAIVTENIVFSRLLGVSPFVKVTEKLRSAFAFGLFTTAVGVFSVACEWIVYTVILEKNGSEYLSFFTLAFFSAVFTQLLSNILNKTDSAMYREMRDVLPLAALNAVMIGTAAIANSGSVGFAGTVIYDFAYSIGFFFSVFAFCSVRQRLSVADPPKAFKGTPAAFIALGLVIMAFYGLTGIRFGDMLSTVFIRFKM